MSFRSLLSQTCSIERKTAIATWATATAYVVGDYVIDTATGTVAYICAVAHTSGVFATDLAAGKWTATSLVVHGGHGHDKEIFVEEATGVRCRLTSPDGKEQTDGVESTIYDAKIHFESDVDMIEGDQVVVGSNRFDVAAPVTHQGRATAHHKSAMLYRAT